MSFARYPAYKDSGVEWLGEVPRHWTAGRFSRVVFAIKDGTHGTFNRTDDGVPFLSAKNVANGGLDITDAESQISIEDHESITANGFPQKDDLLLTIVGTIGRACIYPLEKPIAFQRSVCFIRLTKECFPQFFYYFTQSKFFQEQLMSKSKSSAQAGVYMGDVSATSVAYPTLRAEQRAIATFLDTETAKIDGLMAEQRALVALLKEKRQAVISHAVTKGLHPAAPMKDSGVAWLGEVPGHWEVKSIKWISPVQRGASPRPIDDPKYFDDDGEYAWVRIADVSASDGELRETTQRLSDLGSSLSVKVEPGDLFISIAGTVGKPCVTSIKACIHDGFVYFPKLKLDPQFFFRIFEAEICYGGLGKFGTQLNLNTDTIGSIKIAVPPPEELTNLLTFIDKETSQIDTLTQEAQTAIALLQERRTALISAAVTGMMDVRAVVAA